MMRRIHFYKPDRALNFTPCTNFKELNQFEDEFIGVKKDLVTVYRAN